MKFENVSVMNFENAIRGARNPLESWDRMDSFFGLVSENEVYANALAVAEKWVDKYPERDLEETIKFLQSNGILREDPHRGICEVVFIGPNDMGLCQKLIKAGNEHRKLMRQLFVSVDITGPLYW